MSKTKFDLNNLKSNQYQIHDNRLRPFIVEIDDEKEIKIYKLLDLKEKGIYQYFCSISGYEKVFLGKDNDINIPCEGNTILIKINKFNYISIGMNIFSFQTDEEIVRYESVIGNNDVPYPVAYSRNNVYLISEEKYYSINLVQIVNSVDLLDEYGVWFGHIKTNPPFDMNLIKSFNKVVEIHKRLV